VATAQATIARGFRSMPLPAIAAFTAMGLFIILMGLFGASSGFKSAAVPVGLLVSVSLVAVAFHLVMFLVVAAMPAPSWAKAAGYGWLVVDIACSIMTLNGVAASITTPLRYGGHIPAGIWIAAAAWQAGGVVRYVGVALAICLAGYSFIAPWVPFVGFVPAIILMIAWLPLVGRTLLRG